MHLLIDARPLLNARLGGVGRVTQALIEGYAETFREDRVTCVTTGSGETFLPEAIMQHHNVRHEHLKVPNKLWSAGCMLNLHRLDDIVPDADAMLLPNLGFVGRLPKKILTSLVVHDLSFLIEPKWFSLKQRWWHHLVAAKRLITSVDHLFAVSKRTKQDLIDLLHIPAPRITVLPIGVNGMEKELRTENWELREHNGPPTPQFPIPSSQFPVLNSQFLLCMGWDDPRKNIHALLPVVDILRKEQAFANLHLVIVGKSGSSKNLPSWTSFVDHPDDVELQHLYTSAAAFIYPSWYEGFGLPLHEAATYGTPCIASVSGALPETAPANTVFIHPAKPQQWIEAIRHILSKPRPLPIQGPNSWPETARLIRFFAQQSQK